MSCFTGPEILHQATVLNWSKRTLRAVAVVDFECAIGTAGCGLH
jgi:hypothetical protein